MILAKHCKKAIRREILVTIQRMSLSITHVILLLNLRSIVYIYCMMSRYQDQWVFDVERI
jgi:hypothetical protein